MNKFNLAETTTDPKIIDYLSKDENCGVRCVVARNPNTSSETLKQMAIDEDYLYIEECKKTNTRNYFSSIMTDEQILELANKHFNYQKEWTANTEDLLKFARAIYDIGNENGYDIGYGNGWDICDVANRPSYL